MEEWRVREELARVEAEYREVLRSSVEFEKKIRDRWREKSRQKNRRISELEQRVAELERRLEEGDQVLLGFGFQAPGFMWAATILTPT